MGDTDEGLRAQRAVRVLAHLVEAGDASVAELQDGTARQTKRAVQMLRESGLARYGPGDKRWHPTGYGRWAVGGDR